MIENSESIEVKIKGEKKVDKRKQSASIIHVHALSASAIAGVTSQLSFLSIPFSAALAGNMFSRLIRTFHPDVEDVEDVAASVGAMFIGWGSATLIARSVIGVVPVFGNVASAAITFTLFESIGWAVYAILKDGRDVTSITKDEFKKFIKLGQQEKLNVQKAIKKMAPHHKAEYEYLVEQLESADISEDERSEIHAKIENLLDTYL